MMELAIYAAAFALGVIFGILIVVVAGWAVMKDGGGVRFPW